MKYLFLLIFMISPINIIFSQEKIKIVDKAKLKYYNVYKAIDISNPTNDTLILLGAKENNHEFKTVRLKVNNQYEIKTRPTSRIKYKRKTYIFLHFGITKINGITISKVNTLPVLILDYRKIK